MRRILFFFTPFLLTALDYEINFVGFTDASALKSMFDVSDLVTLQERPPASINALRYRAASDVPELLKVLRAYGYYDSMITVEVDADTAPVQVSLIIHAGSQYTLSSYLVLNQQCSIELAEPTNIEIGGPALSTDIVNAELDVLSQLANVGHPLALVDKRKIEVDMMEKEVRAQVCINEGPEVAFGPVQFEGLSKVKERFVFDKLKWQEGQIYNANCVEATQKKLLNSDLFSSVMITHDEIPDSDGNLPMHINLTEARMKNFSVGAFYATVDGWGGQFSWTNRNIRGLGETLHINGEFSTRYLAGAVQYKMPDFFGDDQTYRVLGEVEREHIQPYTAFTYRGANYFDKKIDNRKNFTVGFEVEHINVSQSATNGTYLLASLPFMARYMNADDLLDPTRGYTLVYQVAPYQSLFEGNVHFIKQRLTGTFYLPFYKKKFIFAGRAQFGSIAGTNQTNVPLPVLFLGGSEDDLRGYRYMTVSPINSENQPLGGRSAVYLSAETRIRLTQTIGVVPFADFGTVTLGEMPTLNAKWFKSVGVGLRYYTFFGPIRADIGFPLDRRPGIDHRYRVYVSVGQTF